MGTIYFTLRKEVWSCSIFVRKSCEEISKCPSRVRISFGRRLCLHRKNFIIQPRKGYCIDLWPRGEAMITLWFSAETLVYCCTSLVELTTLYGWFVALHENDVVIQCIPYIKTCHRMYTNICWAFMRLQGQLPHHHLLDLGRKAVGKCSFSTLCF